MNPSHSLRFTTRQGMRPATSPRRDDEGTLRSGRSIGRCLRLLTFLALVPAVQAVPAVIRVDFGDQVVGRTPLIVGYNLGENHPGSNVTAWLRYSETNGARLFWSSAAWPAEPTPWESGAADEARFRASVEALRATGPDPATRAAHRAAVAKTYGGTTRGIVGDCFTLSETRGLGSHILAMLGHTTRGLPMVRDDGTPDWFGRWSYWRGIYLNASYLAEHYGVERFQLFNEPNHPNSARLSQEDYLRRMQVGSDAIRAAIADVNRRLGRSARAQISAPVSAGILVLKARPERKERDAAVGWGELLFRHWRDPFPGAVVDEGTLFQTYAFQAYTKDPKKLSADLAELRRQVDAASGGVPVPLIASECNVSTAANFLKTKDTLDTPSYYAALGAIGTAYINAGLAELYIFRLTQSDNFGGGAIKKNGTHVVDNRDPKKNIVRATKAAEVVRLLARGFKGARQRIAPPDTLPSGLFAAVAHDESTGLRHLLLANVGDEQSLSLGLAAWALPAGAPWQIEAVDDSHDGEVVRAGKLAGDARLDVAVPARSVALLVLDPKGDGSRMPPGFPRPAALAR